jgi:hypothetical protein
MRPPVTSKRDMYVRLTAGEFGNTNPSWDGLDNWCLDGRNAGYALWGVRSKVANDPRTRLNVATDGVVRYCEENRLLEANISPMVKAWSVQWEGDICYRHDGPGLLCSGNVGIEPGSWRTHMKHPRLWEGSVADRLLRLYLNDNSYSHVRELLDEYPDHVVELSALDYCFGTVPDHNAVIWEVRKY